MECLPYVRGAENFDGEYIQAVKEILPKGPSGHRALQVAIGRGNHPHVQRESDEFRQDARIPAPPKRAEGRSAFPQALRQSRPGRSFHPSAHSKRPIRRCGERELATRNLEREAKVLCSVRQALNRIEDGTYGLCLQCEDEIGPKRLNALPWTLLCIDCQKQADDNREWGIEPHESLLVHAA
jgi:DnaK suppressor protein